MDLNIIGQIFILQCCNALTDDLNCPIVRCCKHMQPVSFMTPLNWSDMISCNLLRHVHRLQTLNSWIQYSINPFHVFISRLKNCFFAIFHHNKWLVSSSAVFKLKEKWLHITLDLNLIVVFILNWYYTALIL